MLSRQRMRTSDETMTTLPLTDPRVKPRTAARPPQPHTSKNSFFHQRRLLLPQPRSRARKPLHMRISATHARVASAFAVPGPFSETRSDPYL